MYSSRTVMNRKRREREWVMIEYGQRLRLGEDRKCNGESIGGLIF